MLTEIILSAKMGGFTVMRMPYFSLKTGRRLVSYADMRITDIDYELYKALKVTDSAKVRFGYRTGVQAEAELEITGISAIGKDTLRVIAAGIEYRLVKTLITESFNDEQPSAVIRRIASLAGLQAGTIDIPDEPLPHIVFSGITLFQALAQLRSIIRRNGFSNEQDFWVYNGQLHWGSHRHSKATSAAVYGNILSHRVKTDGMNLLELPLTPELIHSETISVHDGRRSKQGQYTVYAVQHIFEGEKTRTWVEYR